MNGRPETVLAVLIQIQSVILATPPAFILDQDQILCKKDRLRSTLERVSRNQPFGLFLGTTKKTLFQVSFFKVQGALVLRKGVNNTPARCFPLAKKGSGGCPTLAFRLSESVRFLCLPSIIRRAPPLSTRLERGPCGQREGGG